MATQDILIGYAKIWYAPTGEANPDETTIGYGDAWGGNWAYLGDTLEPATISLDREVFNVDIQQSTSPVKQSIVNMTMNIQTTLAEHTITSLNILFGGTVTTTAAGASQVGYSELVFGGETDPDIYKWGLEALYKDALNNQHPVRYFFHKGSITLNGDINFDKGAATGLPIQITTLNDTTQVAGAQIGTVQIVTAPATA